MIRIVLAGEWRGSKKAHQSLKNFKDYYGAKVYVSSHQKWELPFQFNFHKGNPFLIDTIFNHSKHRDKERYIYQWSGLYNCWNAFNKKWNDTDIVIKLRNDLVFPIFHLNPQPNTISVPFKEFHASPFNTKIMCNDQIIYGYKTVMDKYFQLPLTFQWPIEKMGNSFYSKGIESILRQHLYNENLNLETFYLIYSKSLKSDNPTDNFVELNKDLNFHEFSKGDILNSFRYAIDKVKTSPLVLGKEVYDEFLWEKMNEYLKIINR